mgnify:FL=1
MGNSGLAMETVVTLNDLAVGTAARIVRVDMPPSEAQRLMEMGLTPGTLVVLLKRAPMRDPIEISARGGHLSLRTSAAKSIAVTPVEGR